MRSGMSSSLLDTSGIVNARARDDNILKINRQDVRNGNFLGITRSLSGDPDVFAGEISGEGYFGSIKIVRKAARALLVASVTDEYPISRSIGWFTQPRTFPTRPRQMATALKWKKPGCS